MKKLIRFLYIFVLIFVLSGCGGMDAVPAEFGTSESTFAEAEEDAISIEEDGSYDTAPEVALYLVTYHKLPGNYITKKEARELGWNGGPLEEYAPGKSIGGGVFGNREGLLPNNHRYHECDIEATGKKRGEKRLVYSEIFEVYYTGDHYNSFTRLY